MCFVQKPVRPFAGKVVPKKIVTLFTLLLYVKGKRKTMQIADSFFGVICFVSDAGNISLFTPYWSLFCFLLEMFNSLCDFMYKPH